ncbi:hypothetical protein CT19431_MP80421 [Cupriavidus taiwanensis]|nr:hypothetical protein CT19431_MP80421 [Cupriavidus taiwanensis]
MVSISAPTFQIGMTKFGNGCQGSAPVPHVNFLNSHCEDTELPFAAALR